MANLQAVQRAQALAKEYETHCPFELCAALGIVVLRHKLEDLRGYYRRTMGIDFVVLADDLPPHVERFVCGHELGHAVLHQHLNRLFMDAHTFMLPDRYENEADSFAAVLCYARAEDAVDEQELAGCLNVPVMVARERLRQLGIGCPAELSPL